MRSYVVRRGDYLTKIAARFGVTIDAVWDLPQNSEIKKLRDPNVLTPGDIVRIPPRPEYAMQYSANQDNRFKVAIPTVPLEVTFSELGSPLKSEDYEVHGLGRVVKGTTNGEGRATIAVRADVDAIDVRFAKRELSFTLRIGDVDPAHTERGASQRLAALRFLYHSDDALPAVRRQRLRRATRLFQAAEGLAPTGDLDAETLACLAKRAGY